MNNNVFLMAASLLLITLLNAPNASAQDVNTTPSSSARVLTLDECLQIAMSNNIGLKRSKNSALIARADYFQSLVAYLPDVDAQINYDLYNGTFFDNNAARQVSAVSNSSSPNLDASWVLFNGFSNHYDKKAALKLRDASANAIAEQKQNVESDVLASYLQVILDKENINISKNRVELLQVQLKRERKRESVGVGNLEQVYNFQSQLANENLQLVKMENALMTDMLSLLQILRLEISEKYDIAPYEHIDPEHLLENEKFSEVLESSLLFSPGMKRSKELSNAAYFNYKSAKSKHYPTVSAFGRIGSSFSSNGALNPKSGEQVPGASFSNQIEWNRFDYVNVSISMPITGFLRTRNTSQVAKLNMENARLDYDQTSVDVTNTIQRVFLELVSAQETYKAAQDNLIALDQSFEFVKTRYENGNTDFYTYLESLNNKNRAEIELVNSKYSIVFRKKILDVYRGLM